MISVIVISYNSVSYLEACLKSIVAQEGVEFEVMLVDNDSTDGSANFVAKHFPDVRVIRQANKGFGGGANAGIKISKGEYVLIMNPDVELAPDFLKTLAHKMSYAKEIGIIGGKLLQLKTSAFQSTINHEPSTIIDSAGLLMFRNRRCVDRGQGQVDSGQYDQPEEVFGITGACMMFRREALEDAMVCGEYFDEDFFMYKEDVDICWRLRLFGWRSFYEPAAVGYHARGTGILVRKSLTEVAKNRDQLSRQQKIWSYRNERLMRVKNEIPGTFLRHAPWILAREILHFGWILLREPYLIGSMWQLLRLLPRALKKRRIILRKHKKVPEKLPFKTASS